LECSQAAVAVASAKKNYPNAKFSWYGKREGCKTLQKNQEIIKVIQE
jgi:ADP-heptose:LPS heptosyltransferase